MAERSTTHLPQLSSEQRRVAQETFEHARNALETKNYDYATTLLRTCCKIDPANSQFRMMLRRTQKEKYSNNMRGSTLAFLTTPRYKAQVKAAKASRDYLRVLNLGEDVLTLNPWDLGTQMDMAEAFEALGLSDLAVFSLDQARQKYPNDPTLNRALARLFEKRSEFKKAIVLWQLVQNADPKDLEAASKAKNLAASETIARGGYEASVSGSKESPVVGRMEAAAMEKVDRVGREAAALQKRIEADPDEPSLYIQLAAVYRRNNQLDRARAALQHGLVPTNKHASLLIELQELELLPLRKRLETIADTIEKLNQKHEDDTAEELPSLDELTAEKRKLKKDVLQKEVVLLKAKIERFPTEMIHHFDLGMRLLKLDKVDEAIAEFQQARREEKIKGQSAMYLGLCFRKRNNWKLAERNFEEALTLLTGLNDEKHRKEVLFQLATGAAEQLQFVRAVELGNELANLDFGYRNISQLLDNWQQAETQES